MGTRNSKPSKNHLFNDTLFSDVIVKFSGRSIHCHKPILMLRSVYFYKAFSGNFREAHANEIDLGASDDPNVVEALLRHCYDLEYDDESLAGTGDMALTFHAHVFLLADKYDVPSLRYEVLDAYKTFAADCSIFDIDKDEIKKAYKVVFAGKLGDERLQQNVLKYLDHNIIHWVRQREQFEQFIEPENDTLIGALLRVTIANGNLESIPFCQQCGFRIRGRAESHICANVQGLYQC